ncbi:MAG: sulfatase-like hydrolase/transferase [Lentisphaerae bacterium]|nr:sulfatase-like hydrolase/transferase [Lentisphaerota bacterium]
MKPNVLLICVDHWPGPLMQAMGHERILTPTLNQLARSGVLFSQAYSATPTCIPARRTLMTGTTARTHGDRVFKERLEMDPRLPTLPQVFREAGYQTYAVGKLHVFPQRARIGFDEVILNEEGRHHLGGGRDDFERFLDREGYAGRELTHAMGNNEYCARPWHLPEYCHPTNWTTREMCYAIQRRDPTCPAFWYCSYAAPHQPVTPPRDYWEMYRQSGVDEPFIGEWAKDPATWPYALKRHQDKFSEMSSAEKQLARQGFYAQCTYIDHQMRLLIGTLREAGWLDNTIVMFVCDHGDMLGNHNLWCKPPMFEWSAKIPMVLMPTAAYERVGHHQRDDRLAELRDVMPTLLDLCGLPIPRTVEGHSLVSDYRRAHLYGEHYEDDLAMRMIRSDQYKLIWYPVGNRFQLFDLARDPRELRDLADDPTLVDVRKRLTTLLAEHLYGSDLKWVRQGELVGEPEKTFVPSPNRGLLSQRGWR